MLDFLQFLVSDHVGDGLTRDGSVVLRLEIGYQVYCADLVAQTDSLPDGLFRLLDLLRDCLR